MKNNIFSGWLAYICIRATQAAVAGTSCNENDLNQDSGFCIFFYTEQKYCDIFRLLKNTYARSEKLEYEK